MSLVDDFLKKMKMADDDDYDDDYEEFQFEDDADEELLSKKKTKKSSARGLLDDKDAGSEPENTGSYARSQNPPAEKRNVVGMRTGRNGGNNEVCMIMPKNYEDANTIADVLLSHRAVILNLEGIDMSAAQRIIDFASGACYTVGGSLQKISKKIFMIVPQDMNLSGDFDALVGDMVDLNSVNMMK